MPAGRTNKIYLCRSSRPTIAKSSARYNPLAMKRKGWRALIEVGFIVFLFYSNLLMGEFERSGMGQKRGLLWAIGDILTLSNAGIAAVAAVIGYLLFEFLRTKL